MDSTGGAEHVNAVPHKFPATQKFPSSKVVRRLENEFTDLSSSPVENFVLLKYPLRPLQWHFIYRGPKGTPFEGGEYHGDILFKNKFPFDPPILVFNFYNGRILRGHKIYAIQPRWWNCSMSTRDILNEVNSIFYTGAPRIPGTIFEQNFHLKVLAERSEFTGCAFCRKQEQLTSSNHEYMEAAKRWKEIESKPVNEGIGNWWNELRLIVIKNDELELERIDKRNYEYCAERTSAKINSHLILLNWRTIARDVLAPIIYRYYLMAVLIACFVSLIIILSKSLFKWSVRALAIVDLICLFIIALQESGAIYAFTKPRQLRGPLRKVSGVLGLFSLGAVVLHIAMAIAISVLATDDKYEDERTVVVVYIVTAFANDCYHYFMGLLFCLNVGFHYVGCAVEALVTCKLFGKKIHSVTLKKYTGAVENAPQTCPICKDNIQKDADLFYLGCNEQHAYHKECLLELYKEVQKCPLCKQPYKINSSIEEIHIDIENKFP
eukprot:TRINITY_DN6167_c0_g1_i8.p1 TRINITY_DN6167_c0_g1~~TRINITY_DN6167_c0_g1_i8.p1  ORF type:complete len:493 (+),score=105.84 TRINITY_DN6167_c0_g1_i8:185-1663(+)